MFTWFTTLTFRDQPVQSYTAINRAKKFLRAIEREEELKIGYYMALESNIQGTVHFHALMGNLEGVQRSTWWKWWYTRYGAARILPYNPKLGAGYYLTKYVVKDEFQQGWFDIQNLHLLEEVG